MPLRERIRRKIVPRRGICSIVPAADALLTSGNGAMTIETACDPYSEQIAFRHESLFTPRKRPFEAPRIAGIFPQVRQMLLDGKYHEAAKLGYDEWHKSPDRGPWVLRRRGILDAAGVSQDRRGEGLSPHIGFRNHRVESPLDRRAR